MPSGNGDAKASKPVKRPAGNWTTPPATAVSLHDTLHDTMEMTAPAPPQPQTGPAEMSEAQVAAVPSVTVIVPPATLHPPVQGPLRTSIDRASTVTSQTGSRYDKHASLMNLQHIFRFRSAPVVATAPKYPDCPHFTAVFARANNGSTSKLGSPVILVGAPPPLERVLADAEPAPFDRNSYLAFSRKVLCPELPAFYLAVRAFEACTNTSYDHYQREVQWILDEFISEKADHQINIDVKPRKNAENLARANLEKRKIDRTIFMSVQTDILQLMTVDVYPKFLNSITLKRRLVLARQEALWWMHPSTWKDLTFKEFFKFPNPINETDARCHNFCLFSLVVVGCLLHAAGIAAGKWVLVYAAYGFLARVTCGSRLDPQAYVVLFIISPIVARVLNSSPKFVAGPPKRFAQLCGLIFSSVGLALIFTDNPIPAYILYGILAFMSFLSCVFNLCLACHVIYFLSSRGYLPPDVCSDCNAEYCSSNALTEHRGMSLGNAKVNHGPENA
ncbi:hypothetical protein PhCBS80983_g06211 [Powellomyces hirtus]|uniref:RGS domain-containing protein n=1 Tax=Powellomyces hirtus TaxID=109895 RepID=A0A507DRX9_9FUNG|nr:hypothetical protein PhCBS80983_g06211 [Powellomyces hirtus]